MSGKMAMPGDELATSEEYMPGPGTYERDGMIFAAVMGKPAFMESDKTVRIIAVRRSCMLRPGDAVLGMVTSVSNTMATVAISGLDGSPARPIYGESGVVHVSKVTDAYTDDVRKELRIGDMVRASVIQAQPSLQLSTRGGEFGVLKARCGRCRAVLFNRSGRLYCADCEKFEQRKLAADFGRYSPELVE